MKKKKSALKKIFAPRRWNPAFWAMFAVFCLYGTVCNVSHALKSTFADICAYVREEVRP